MGCVYGQGRFWKGLGVILHLYIQVLGILGHFTSHHEITLIFFETKRSARRPLRDREDVEPAGPPERRSPQGLGFRVFRFYG